MAISVPANFLSVSNTCAHSRLNFRPKVDPSSRNEGFTYIMRFYFLVDSDNSERRKPMACGTLVSTNMYYIHVWEEIREFPESKFSHWNETCYGGGSVLNLINFCTLVFAESDTLENSQGWNWRIGHSLNFHDKSVWNVWVNDCRVCQQNTISFIPIKLTGIWFVVYGITFRMIISSQIYTVFS